MFPLADSEGPDQTAYAPRHVFYFWHGAAQMIQGIKAYK